MKRLTKAAALLAAGTLLLGALISCTPHGAGGAFDSATDNGGGSGEQEEDFDTPTKVDALWDFVNASAVPTGITATLAAGADFTSVATMNDDTTKSGIGASFKFVDGSASKFKTLAEEPTKGAGIYVTGGTDAVNDAGTGYKGKFALTIKYKANVELMVAGNGSNDGRWIVVTNSSGTKVGQKTFTSEANTIVDAEKFDLGELDGGVYYIYALGCRIFRLSTLNDVEEVTPVPITGVSVSTSSDEIKVGDSTTLTATITPSTTTEDKTVAWSITEGETKVTLSATTGAEITVTGAAAGSATITASITVNGKTYSKTCSVTVTSPSVKLSSTSGNSSDDHVYYYSGNKTFYAMIVKLPTATCTPSGTASWSVASGSATISNGYLLISQPGTVVARASFSYGGKTYTADYTYTRAVTFYAGSAFTLRSGPSTSSSSLGSIPKGTSLTTSGLDYSDGTYVWGKVTYNGKTGYVALWRKDRSESNGIITIS